MWNNSKSPIRYMWKKISDCHIIEVEPCTGVIGTWDLQECVTCAEESNIRVRRACGRPWCLAIRSSQDLWHVPDEAWKGWRSSPDHRRRPSHFSSFCFPLSEPNEVGNFELNFTGGVPGPASQDLLCEIRHSPSPVVLHIEAAFKVCRWGWAAGGPREVAGVEHRAHSWTI